MKYYISALIVLGIFVTCTGQAQSNLYGSKWLEVYRLELKERPQSALVIVDSIYHDAKAHGNESQWIKALIYQSKFALTLEEDARLKIVKRFREEIAASNGTARAILHNYLAEMFWQFLQQNQWKLYNRTETTKKVDSVDLRTWDMQTLLKEIDHHFHQSLKDWQQLGADLSRHDPLIDRYDSANSYRPTLADILAHNAIDFFKADKAYLVSDAYPFQFDASHFAPFEQIHLPDTIGKSKLKALNLYLKLTRMHHSRKDTTALIAADLERLKYVVSEVGEADQNYLNSLKRLLQDFKQHPASSLIDFSIASFHFDQGNKPMALEVCRRAIKRFPRSEGAEKCAKLQEHILKKAVSVLSEEYIIPQQPAKVRVTYTNVDSLYFKAYQLKQTQVKFFNSIRKEADRTAFIDSLLPVEAWTADLIDTHDYDEHTTEVVVPALDKGTYLIAAGTSADILLPDSLQAYQVVQVTNLALLDATVNNQKRFQLVDRTTGAPVKGGSIHIKDDSRRNYNTPFDKTLVTDEQGFAYLPLPDHYVYAMAEVMHQGDTATVSGVNINRRYNPSPHTTSDHMEAKAVLFTDRSIYRPGQKVYFKGILLKIVDEHSSIVPGEYVEVYLDDVNGEEVGFLRLRTNEYGSFSGEFTLPEHGLTGEYTLYADEDYEEDSKFYNEEVDYFEWNEVYISVEEYKRPTFEVTFDPVKEAYGLNDTVTVTGKAISFSGANISNAKVTYSVQRTVGYPSWWHYSSWHRSPPVEITSGERTTDQNGNYTISFLAVPDDSKAGNPVFNYQITADVTDISGETHSTSTIMKAGYHTLSASLAIPEDINTREGKITLSYTITNLNEQKADAAGNIKIYPLRAPAAPQRDRPWPAPDRPLLSEAEFSKLFPHEPYREQGDWKQWPRDSARLAFAFDTRDTTAKAIDFSRGWQPGAYVAELTTTDEKGNNIVAKAWFKVIDSGNKKAPDNQQIVVRKDKHRYNIGDQVKLTIGTAAKDVTVVIDIDKNHKIEETRLLHLSEETITLPLEISKDDLDGFAIHYYLVAYNSLISGSEIIRVNRPESKIEIETVTFRDKLMPGAEETWSLRVKGSKKERKETELLASMYDASLDQFKEHKWLFNPNPPEPYYAYNYISRRSFENVSFRIENAGYNYYRAPSTRHHQLNWFGFSLGNEYVNKEYLRRLQVYNLEQFDSKVKVSQDKTKAAGYVYGMVTSAEDGLPLPGVNVIVKGTTRGTITDIRGNYSIAINEGDKLVVSFVGMGTEEVKIGDGNIINIQMAPDVQHLSEVVVTGYGAVRKQDLLGASVVEVADEEEISEEIMVDLKVEAALSGKVSGLAIRGSNTLNAGNMPLYVVDGIVVDNTTLGTDDIASIEMLKGEAATALYGAQGAHGVVIITTKSGQKKLDELLARMKARSDLRETAFFYPHLKTNKKGEINFSFTTPEALTRWKLQLLAHNKDLKTGYRQLSAVTQKELMVAPNAPRFFRKGDRMVLPAKIVNLTDEPQVVQAELQLSDAGTGEEIKLLKKQRQTVNVPAQSSSTVEWQLEVPEMHDALQFKVVATNGTYSDGEQRILPVLSNRQLVTEALPMTVKGHSSQQFALEKLKNNQSPTLTHHQLVLEVTANPIWYAVKSLPYLMEYPFECSEQTFSRLYANLLASHITKTYPEIKKVFDQWKSSGALISNLEKNPELKALLIQETPWLRDAQSETEQQKRIALLFDLKKTADEAAETFKKLEMMQLNDGGFPWFSGNSSANRFISQHIIAGLGHLQQLGVKVEFENYRWLINGGIKYMDAEIAGDYQRLLDKASESDEDYWKKKHIHHLQVHYLYTRSFFEHELKDEQKKIFDYYLQQSADYWTEFDLMTKAMTAIVHQRAGNHTVAQDIMRSLQETSIISDERGMYWKANAGGYHWYNAAIETQAMLVEAFHEVMPDTTRNKPQMINDLQHWLLMHKQVNQWPTTKATTEAVYAVLLNENKINSVDDVQVTLGGAPVTPESTEAGSGYFKQQWDQEQITPAMATVEVDNKGDDPVWAALYWQYFEQSDKITAASTTALSLTKQLFKVGRNEHGEVLTRIDTTSALQPGDLLRVRIELKADRDMEFLHMKDQRASGLEPTTTLSQYKWQDGLGYYQSTRDASTNFFIDKLPKGVYVFEYDLRVNNSGSFSNGITTIQNMYAPQFGSHSGGGRVLIGGEELSSGQ